MKKLLSAVFSVVFSIALPALDAPLMHFEFSDMKPDGIVPNRGKGNYTAKVEGKYSLSGDGILRMDGLSTRVTVTGSEDFDVSANATFSIFYRRAKLESNNVSNRSMDGLFSKSGVFLMAKYKNHFYGNVHNGKKWAATCQIFDTFPESDLQWHHLVMSVEYFRNWNEAEEWVEFVFYIDGVNVGRKRFKDVSIRKNLSKLEIGSNSGMGPSWMLGGEIADARVFDRVLSEAEVRELTLSRKLAKPGFKPEKRLSPEMERMIAAWNAPRAEKLAVRNLALLEREAVRINAVLDAPEKYLTILPGKESDLAVFHTEGFAHVCSWYDRRAERELFKGDNPFVEWTLRTGGEMKTLSPLDSSIVSHLERKPRRTPSGNWEFSIVYRSADGRLAARSDYVFRNDRLEFRHAAESRKNDTMIFSASCPKFSICGFNGAKETLLTPYGCGVPHARPTANNFRYSNPYPRAFASMQFVSYYDESGGLYIAAEDPRGRGKHLTFTCSPNRVDGAFLWRVPYDRPGGANVFDPECRVAVELFRGDWYDAGMVYRRVLAEIGAPWFRRTLPDTRVPEYFRNNSVWLTATYLGEYDPAIPRLRRYFGQDMYLGDVWKWWEPGICINLSPTMRNTPEWIEWLRQLRRQGIRCQPYIDGRLWGEKDRRGEDYLFSSFAHPLNVVSDGVPVRELYAVPCDVLCPATKGYQEHFFAFIRTLTMQGLDGLYIDQLGACYQPPCHQAELHGHRYADWDSWYLNGYARLLRRLRAFWKEKGTEKVLTTEDNAEMFVGLMDGMEVYRWMTDGQVPLFPLVYSGRVQFYNRHARTRAARFQTVAEQLVNSEQLGSFGVGELASPFNAELRSYVKRLAWLRRAMLDFFNAGMMSRPGGFRNPLVEKKRFWGDFGTKYVTKPQVQSSVWVKDGVYAAILVNSEPEPCSNVFRFPLPRGDYMLDVFDSDCPEVKSSPIRSAGPEVAFTLQPFGCMLLLLSPAGTDGSAIRCRVSEAFGMIRATRTEHDPFGVDSLPDSEPFDIRKPMHLLDSSVVTGARRNRELDRIDYVSYAMLYPGVMDFGSCPPRELVLETACGTPQGGTIRVYADEIGKEDLIAEIVLSPDFRTKHWNDFVLVRVPLRKPLTGKHKIVFSVEGLGFCNLKHWYVK